MFNKDPELSLHINDPYNPHSIILKLIPPKKTVLDIGCNAGYIGHYLIKNKNCVCDGIDCSEKFLTKAKKGGYRNVFKINLYLDSFALKEKYDILLFIDILEHLPNPYLILLKLVKENLKKDGVAIICLPNIGRFEHRLKHLFGKFNYEKSGIICQDHLRFFTKETALNMLKKTNLQIVKILPTGLGAIMKIFPTLLSYQFIFICKK